MFFPRENALCMKKGAYAINLTKHYYLTLCTQNESLYLHDGQWGQAEFLILLKKSNI